MVEESDIVLFYSKRCIRNHLYIDTDILMCAIYSMHVYGIRSSVTYVEFSKRTGKMAIFSGNDDLYLWQIYAHSASRGESMDN